MTGVKTCSSRALLDYIVRNKAISNFGTNLELCVCSVGEFRLTSDFGNGVPLLVGKLNSGESRLRHNVKFRLRGLTFDRKIEYSLNWF